MGIAIRTAQLSKDRRAKVGAVIAGNSREILSVLLFCNKLVEF
jgi:deoxycytidylate deaminase